ncbi:biotin/lipoyl attachment domain-containing protein isoform X2 [Wolffia australiana]
MDGISVVRSLLGAKPNARSFLKKPSSFSAPSFASGFPLASTAERKLFLLPKTHSRNLHSCIKAAKDASEQITISPEKKRTNSTAFPSGFETLMLDVCDETDIAELKIKVGGFEMHLRRNVEAPKAPPSPPSIVSPTMAPPIPSEPMSELISESSPATTSSQKPATQTPTSPFSNNLSAKSKKLAELEASGVKTYALVSSPSVGIFRTGRLIRGKRQPPTFKEGDLISEGHVIGCLDQLGNELLIKSDVAGEVLKILYKDGDAVGFGDPLVAVLPSFHDIKL